MGEEILNLNYNFASEQINAINDVKNNNESAEQPEDENIDAQSIFKDIEAYQQNGEDANIVNDEFIDYVNKTMGMDNFLALINTDEDKGISEEEFNSFISKYGDKGISYSDIDEFKQDIADISDAVTVDDKGNKTEYKADSKGELQEIDINKTTKTDKTETKKDTIDISKIKDKETEKTEETKEADKTEKEDELIEVDGKKVKNPLGLNVDKIKISKTDGNNITEIIDESGNKIKYNYDSTGKLTGCTKYLGDSNEVMNECTYNDKYQIATKREYISEETGLKGDYFHTYTYDDNGRVATAKVYTGDSASGTPIGDYEYSYDGDSTTPTSRTNKATNIKEKYEYDDDGNRVGTTFYDTTGNKLYKYNYNKDGTIKSIEEDETTTIFEYKNGLRTKATTYKMNGNETEEIVSTNTYEDGRLKSVEKGEYTYVYDNFNSSPKIYKTTDCVEGVPKSGALPVSTALSSLINPTMTNTISNSDIKMDVNFNETLQNISSAELDEAINNYKNNASTYQDISNKVYEQIGVKIPPELISAIHYRESNNDFTTYLHNGEPLGQVTTLVPAGIYFDNFTDAAVDALVREYSWYQTKCAEDGYVSDFSTFSSCMEYAEVYNGLGYRDKGNGISPYVYSGTSLYSGGMYVADGVYDGGSFDQRPGTALIMKKLMEIS